ncbi:MAG: hypothetical protein HZA90_12220 [Verrucomicrobia bacterium]|nr:hypothetical protein [Verrucomicrobiota bacterium]
MKIVLPLLLSGLVLLNVDLCAAPLGTAFTYQGRLADAGSPADGIFDLRFAVCDSASGGSPLAVTTNSAVAVANGLFTATLDFGSGLFTGDARWLEIAVRTNGGTAFVTVEPRQPLTPAPHALYAPNAGAATTAASAAAVIANGVANAGLQSNAVTSDKVLDGSVAAADLSPALLASTFWRLDGNAGTSGSTHFLGTSDSQPLHLRVNGERALRLEPDPRGLAVPNLIGGSASNAVSQFGSGGNAIAGGGLWSMPNLILSNSSGNFIGAGSGHAIGPVVNDSVIAGGFSNAVGSHASVVAGGAGNRVEPGFFGGFIGGGQANRVLALNSSVVGGAENAVVGVVDSFIGGGWLNQLSANHTVIVGGLRNTNAGPGATLGGGNNNQVAATANDAFLGGGTANRVEGYRGVLGGGEANNAAANYATVGGGGGNQVESSADGTVITGGFNNYVEAQARAAVIGGGANNRIRTGSDYSVIVGGSSQVIQSNASYAFIGGGTAHSIGTNATYATIPGGRGARADHYGQWAYASGRFASSGDAQSALYVLRAITSGPGTNEMFLDGTRARLTLEPETTMTFHIQVAARSDLGVAAGYEFHGVIHRSAAGATAFVGTVDTTMTKESATALNFLVEADNTLDALVLKAVGTVSHCRWVATVRTTEVSW